MRTALSWRSERGQAAPAALCPGSGAPRRSLRPATPFKVMSLPDLGITELAQAASALASHLPLAYEPVAAPCSLMNCGDAVYRR